MAKKNRQAGSPVLLDTNIILYLYRAYDPKLAKKADTAYGVTNRIIMVEALGWNSISPEEDEYLRNFFKQTDTLELSEAVFERAIKVRKRKKIALPDALIAATAIEHGATLWTANIDDFRDIDDLVVVNPLV